MPEHSEQEIIAGCRKQERYWQEQLHRKYYGMLFRICARYAHNMEDAEQLLQDSFLRIFSRINSYKNAGSFEGWMKQVAVNISLDFLRSRAGRESMEPDLSHLITETIAGSAVQDGLQQLAFKDLLNLIQNLPDATRTIFNLFVFEGYSHRQIASALNITENASSWHVHSARKQLQESILSLKLQHHSYAGK